MTDAVGPHSSTVTVALCRQKLEEAKNALRPFGGVDLLGYALSHGFWDEGHEALLTFAERIQRLVAAEKQLTEAVRIAKWNAQREGSP